MHDQRKSRKWTCLVIDAMDQGFLDPRAVAEMCMSYMSEADVEDMCVCNELRGIDPELDEENDD